MPSGITVAICTRNRYMDLKRCLLSIASQNALNIFLEILVVDDGCLTKCQIEQLRRFINEPHMTLVYHKKNESGLLKSRIVAKDLATYDIILFLDDDVELEANYIAEMYKTFCQSQDVVGVGGVDILMPSKPLWTLYSLAIGYSTFKIGSFSLSGFAGTMNRWSTQRSQFTVQHLHGCNMAFRRKALIELRDVDWLKDYSLGEDLYISIIASHTGFLIVNPEQKIKHWVSSQSRDNGELVAFTEIENHYHLLMLQNHSKWCFILFLWTCFGLYAKSLISWNRQKNIGYKRGLKVVFRNIANDLRFF